MSQRKYFEKPVKRFDIHVHLGELNNGKGCFTAEERLAFDELFGIDYSVILPYPVGNPKDDPMGVLDTEGALKVVETYPEHFGFFVNVLPTGTEETFNQLKEYKEKGALGVGEFGTLYPFDDERVDHLLDCCAKLELPFLMHISPGGTSQYGVIDYPGLPLLEKALQKHPDVLFIGHSQPFWYEMAPYEDALPIGALNGFPFNKITEEGRLQYLFRTYPNLYGDLSANSGSNAILRDPDYGIHFLNEFQDRLMFGSDLLNTEVIFPIGQMLDYYLLSQKINREVYTKICQSNAKRVLKIV